ncbi:hypothetical protein SUGI_0768370 [Cryptomeria japonica]|nr:hypothetical protein SUGI_0768370 [Cryptomeria japonica]
MLWVCASVLGLGLFVLVVSSLEVFVVAIDFALIVDEALAYGALLRGDGGVDEPVEVACRDGCSVVGFSWTLLPLGPVVGSLVGY